MSIKIRFILTFLLTLAVVFVFNIRLGEFPPLGKFLDPVKGVWHNALIPDVPSVEEVYTDGLQEEVKVVFNERGVPHIFATNDHDLYFAAGYITAMHRLWQMEFSTHAAMGRLSEIVGERALEYDKYIRRLGMVYGIEKMYEASLQDETATQAINAYSQGVNAWINQLSPANYPIEYKLLDYRPEPWTPIKSLAVGMNISNTLTSGTRALRMTALKAAWGEEVITGLYTEDQQSIEPIISRDRQWNINLSPPTAPTEPFLPKFLSAILLRERDPNNGSNNWAVSGDKTQTGDALLASDPHLGLSVPSVWYEMQLNAPGINVYGVTFPGAPAILMGFNNFIAWGNTNTGNEVFDLYDIETDESGNYYLYDGAWVPLTYRTEVYRIKGKDTYQERVPYTHHGPIMYKQNERPFSSRIPAAHAIRWTALESGNLITPLLKINTSEDVEQFREALSGLDTPPQNYAVASTSGNIAMQLNGLWPLKWKNQGMFISDGRRSQYEWKGYIPYEHLPYEVNPPRGFISSANQHPTAGNYPFYHGWWFASRARTSIINETLASSDSLTHQDMKNLQLNIRSFWAEQYLDRMIDSTMAYIGINPDTFPENIHETLDELRSWNHLHEAYSIAATVFDQWRQETFRSLWQPLLEPAKDYSPARPSNEVSFKVLFHNSPVDIYRNLFQHNPPTGELLAQSLLEVVNKLNADHGPMGESWHWWRFNGSTIRHMLDIPALNQQRLQVGGSNESPNAISNNHGPSWRMVAQMSQPVKAWGIYPGGQTGNPASAGFNAFIRDWAAGRYYELELFDSFEQASVIHIRTITLKPTNSK